MSTIVTRAGKGSPLTNAEVDANFTNLNTDKYQEGSAIGAVTPAAGTFTTLSSNGATTFTNGTAIFSIDDGGGTSTQFRLIGPTSTLGRNRLYSPSQLRISAGSTNAIQFHTAAGSSPNSDGNVQFAVTNTASAVNYVQVTGAATGGNPQLSVQGSDANPNFDIYAKGSGVVRMMPSILIGRNSANYFRADGANAGSAPIISVAGTDTNIDLALTPKGTGTVVANGPFTATGQTSLGGAAGSESLRVLIPATAGAFMQVQGASASAVTVRYTSDAGSNVGVAQVAKGTGTFTFATNNSTSTAQFAISHTSSAVNYVQVTGAATGGRTTISAQGSDASVGLNIYAKGGSSIFFSGNGNNTAFALSHVTSATNYLSAAPSVTGSAPVFAANGTDTNISQVFQSKGTGAIDLAAGSSGVNISNGGTVTALTVTASGTNYTSIPSCTISAPTTAGGVQATASPVMFSGASSTVASGGTGYTVGDTLTVVGGTYTTQATFTVSTVSGGVVTSITRVGGAGYSVLPTSPASTTGGTGTGATINMLWTVGTPTITNAGSGYVEQPTVTFSGGGGSGAAAYATVGASSTLKSIHTQLSVQTAGGEVSRFGSSQGGVATGRVDFSVDQFSRGIITGVNSLVLTSTGTGNVSLQTNSTAQQQMVVSHTASAVNYVQVTGAATGGTPTISAQGSDANINLSLTSKGSGIIFIGGQSSASSSTVRLAPSGGNAFFASSTNASVNYLMASGAPTGNTPQLIARGTDTNIGVRIGALNAGNVDLLASGDPNAGTGVLQLRVAPTASAVNYVQVTGAATGNNVALSAQGSDTNIGMTFATKGSFGMQFNNASGGSIVQYTQNGTVSATTNFLRFTNFNGTGGNPVISAQGSDTNIDLTLTPKGTGVVKTSSTGIQLVGSSSGYVGLKGAAAAGSTTYTLPSADGTTGQVLSTNGAGVLAWASAGGGVTGFTGAESTSSPNATVYVDSLVASATSTNADVAFVAKGTGATLAQVPDATTTAGNKRGSRATDWQKARSTAAQVASGSSSTIGGGSSNTSSGFIATVGGGLSNVASGAYAVIAGGESNQATAGDSAVLGGYLNLATGDASAILGGSTNSANAAASVVLGGKYGTTRGVVGYVAMPASSNPIALSQGLSQAGFLLLGIETTDATPTVLCSNNSTAAASNQLTLPPNSAYYVKGSIIATVTGGGSNTKSWDFIATINQGANATTTAIVGAVTLNVQAGTGLTSSWTVAITADTTYGCLAVTVTGQASKTIRWVCKLETTEVTF